MSMVRIEKGKHLIHKDDAQEKLEIILQGRVNMIIGDEVIPLDTGTIIGIAACEKQRYCCNPGATHRDYAVSSYELF